MFSTKFVPGIFDRLTLLIFRTIKLYEFCIHKVSSFENNKAVDLIHTSPQD